MTRRRSSKTAGEPRVSARGSRRRNGRGHADVAGYSLTELLVVLGIVTAVLIAAIPGLGRAADTADAAASARYLSSIVARARLDAARRQRTVSVRFSRAAPVTFSVVVDGDGDGVNAADIAAGIDPTIRPPDRLDDHFRRARFGIGGPLPAIDEGRTLTAADDPVRFGVADAITLTPLGTASGGTAYITSRAGVQFALRVSGVTGRTRVMRYDQGRTSWQTY